MNNAQLLHLLDRTGDLPAHTIWQLMAPAARKEGLSVMLHHGPKLLKSALVRTIVEAGGGFSAAKLAVASRAELAEHGAKLTFKTQEALVAQALRFYFLDTPRIAIQAEFLDAVGVPHDGTGKLEGRVQGPQASADMVARGVRAFWEAAPPVGDRALYLAVLVSVAPALWPGLAQAIQAVAHSTSHADANAEALGRPVAPPVDTASQDGENGSDVRERAAAVQAGAPRFRHDVVPLRRTILDDSLILGIVRAAANETGALNPAQTEELLTEVISLNSRRYSTWYAVGFADALFRRGSDRTIPASNELRQAWYAVGYLTGLQREGRRSEMLALYDSNATLRELGRRLMVPAPEAVAFVLEALCAEERDADALIFVGAGQAVLPEVAKILLDWATRLIRHGEASRAYPMLDRIIAGAEDLISRNAPPHPAVEALLPTVQRRCAHALREMGRTEEARGIINDLLADASGGPAVRHMLLVDRGLLAAGYRALRDLHVPDDRSQWADVRSQLERGTEDFLAAVEADPDGAAHAHFVLGVYDLLSGARVTALASLRRACAAFEREPERYADGDLLRRARVLMLAASVLEAGNFEELRQQADRLDVHLAEPGAPEVPLPLVPEVLQQIAMVNNERAATLARTALQRSPDLLLDAVAGEVDGEVGSEVGAMIAKALLQRAEDPTRSKGKQVADLRSAIPLLLRTGDIEQARRALARVTDAAIDGQGSEAFLAFLDRSDNHDQAWEPSDIAWSRARTLLTLDRRDDAATVLYGEANRCLATEAGLWEDDVEDIATFIKTRVGGPVAVGYADKLRTRLPVRNSIETVITRPGTPKLVLVVGGNEVQERFDARIHAELARLTGNMVTAEFVHSGWGSNFQPDLERVERHMPRACGVVISRFIRTTFGQHLRRAASGKPWRLCYPSGQTSLLRSILAIAASASGEGETDRTST